MDLIPGLATELDFLLLALSGKFCLTNTAVGSLESCHHTSLSSCLMLRIFKIEKSLSYPILTEEHAEPQSRKWASTAVKMDTTPDGYNHLWLLPTESVLTKRKTKQNTKLNQPPIPKRQVGPEALPPNAEERKMGRVNPSHNLFY